MKGTTIVLLRGMLGFSRLLWWEYFHGAPKLLETMGFTVIVPALPWGESVVRRATFLGDALKDVSAPVHLVAHSMGGVDARHYLTHLDGHEKVASLTTISSPHRGSSVADDAMASPASPWRKIPAVADLTRIAMQQFNETTPDMPGVIYRSYSAARPIQWQVRLMRGFARRLQLAEGANDGQVSVSSAQWGEHVATLTADHFELIGSRIWLNPLRKRPPFDHLALYRDIGTWIAGHHGNA